MPPLYPGGVLRGWLGEHVPGLVLYQPARIRGNPTRPRHSERLRRPPLPSGRAPRGRRASPGIPLAPRPAPHGQLLGRPFLGWTRATVCLPGVGPALLCLKSSPLPESGGHRSETPPDHRTHVAWPSRSGAEAAREQACRGLVWQVEGRGGDRVASREPTCRSAPAPLRTLAPAPPECHLIARRSRALPEGKVAPHCRLVL